MQTWGTPHGYSLFDFSRCCTDSHRRGKSFEFENRKLTRAAKFDRSEAAVAFIQRLGALLLERNARDVSPSVIRQSRTLRLAGFAANPSLTPDRQHRLTSATGSICPLVQCKRPIRSLARVIRWPTSAFRHCVRETIRRATAS